MGLFGFNKKYDICPKEKELSGLVTNYSSHGAKIKINGKLVVPSGYYCVIGKKGKVADKFEEGEYFFNYANLPYLCRKFGIDKIKKGKQKDTISADIYFISKQLYGNKFKTYRKVEMGTRAYGLFKTSVIGVYSYKVKDVKEFMQSLLNEFDYIKTGEAEDIIEAWVNDLIVSELEKKNYILTDVIANNPIIQENLKTSISKLFDVAGLELLELKITRYKLPKEYQEESDKIMSGDSKKNKIKEIENNKLQSSDEIKVENEELKSEILEQEEISENNDIQKQENCEYVPFGNFSFSSKNEKNESQEIHIQEQKPQRTFVDLSLDKLYHNNEQNNLKRCLNCGAENNKYADHCILCGEIFNKGDNYES